MKYSLFVIVCLVIHTFINIDIFRKKPTVNLPALTKYRIFVISVGLYFLIDLLWGIFEENKLAIPLYADTFIYFIIMGFTVLSWARYTTRYLEDKSWLAKVLLIIGNAFFLAEIILLIINIFVPILFSVDRETCEYKAYEARNVMLCVQVGLYLVLMVYTAIKAFRIKNGMRRRYFTITLYSVIMATSIIVQIFDPYLPLYSIGLIVGSTLLNSFVINDIKEEYKTKLEESRVLVEQGKIELNETKQLANTDPLTGVKNKHAYVEEEDRIDKLINKGEMEDFAVAVFDLNGLKIINDTKGHDAGDAYIFNSCQIIAKYFGHENIYRFGGDEFVVILIGDVYKNRSDILNRFEHYIDTCLNTDKPIISSGMSRFRKNADNTYHAVFYRADKMMYARKESLKEHQTNL